MYKNLRKTIVVQHRRRVKLYFTFQTSHCVCEGHQVSVSLAFLKQEKDKNASRAVDLLKKKINLK